MTDDAARAALTDIHIADWTIVHLSGAPSASAGAELAAHVAPMLVTGARVAIDVRRGPVDPAVVASIAALCATAAAADARVVVIEPDRDRRLSLLAEGVPDVYESLDAALHVRAPVITHARSQPDVPPLAPSEADALLVTSEDMTGRGAGR